MLTPEYISLLEFNDVVQLYNKLNIDLTADIIDRISAMEDISVTAKNEMKILIERNGEEVFYEALEKTSMITAERKQLLKKMFSDMASEDMQGYKELYLYRDKLFKLSERQYRILNEGLRATDRLLKNLTNTIAFRTQQAYVEAIDEAYMQTVTGAYSYTNAIQNTVQKLADMGITLKDKAGRNVQLEVAVRRNVLAGIQSTANNINRDIEKELGCDGYEVTAHIGARPTHAEAQGKQYAINKEDSKKYGIGLWSDVSDLWEEYNCRHTYFGIILGISEPVYTDKELNEYKNATVEWNGKKIPHYEATQRQRQLENAIRKQKRTVQILEKAGQDTTIANAKLRSIQKKLNDFCKQTGLDKDYSRTKSTNLLNKVTKKLPLKEKNDKIKKGILEDRLGKEHTSKIIETISKAPKNIQKVWNNFIDKVNINDINYKKTANYSWNENGIYIDLDKISKDRVGEFIGKNEKEVYKKAYGTLYHETGHHISAIFSRKNQKNIDVAEWLESKKYFKEQFAKDGSKIKIGQTLDEMVRKEGWEYIDNVLKEMRKEAKNKGLKVSSVNSTQVYQKISQDLRSMSLLEQQDISDMFDGITNGKAFGYTQHSYSTKDYWKKHKVGTEAFAEMFDATINNPESLKKIKEYFPKSYEIFEEIIKEMGE